jgi:hypothetical protein
LEESFTQPTYWRDLMTEKKTQGIKNITSTTRLYSLKRIGSFSESFRDYYVNDMAQSEMVDDR